MIRHITIVTLASLPLGGCNAMLDHEEKYVLREPIKVRLADRADPMTLPAGTHVTVTFHKSPTAFIDVHGTVNYVQLRNVATRE